MEPRMIHRESFVVQGVAARVRRGTESPELFGRIWRDFEAHRKEIEPLSVATEYFGVSFPTGEEDVTEYVAGMMVAGDTPVLKGLERRAIGGGPFAVFECPVESIGETFRHIFTAWLPSAAVRFDEVRPVFEEYGEGATQRSVCIHVPVGELPGTV